MNSLLAPIGEIPLQPSISNPGWTMHELLVEMRDPGVVMLAQVVATLAQVAVTPDLVALMLGSEA